MGDTIIPSSSEWCHQFYDQTIVHGQTAAAFSSSSPFGFSSDSTIVSTITSSCTSDSLFLSPSCSTTTSGGQLTPKGVGGSKPIRRRSRVSKKTPITLLNANTSNFRALVQQFTGCSSTPTTFGTQRGPINLNFQLGSAHNQSTETRVMDPCSNSYSYSQYCQIQQQQQQQQHNQQQILHQDQVYDLGDVYNFQSAGDNDSSTACRDNIEMADELFTDDFSLQELARDALSDENVNDGYF